MFEQDDIVQITEESHHWYPCFIIVDEVKSWGVQGYLYVPRDNTGNVDTAFIRLNNDEIEKVGKAIICTE